METVCKAFSYKPLDKLEIRLLVLQPGSFNTVISCELLHSSLTDHFEYDALSYVWGNPSVTYDILVSGCTVTISQNLYHALNHLRSEVNEQKLWVDAICINQSDITEKSQQVQIMADIYRAACTVRCWVGRYFEEDDAQENVEVEGTSSILPDTIARLGPDFSMNLAFAFLQIFGTNNKHRIWDQEVLRTLPRADCPSSEMEAMIAALKFTVEDPTMVKGWRDIQRISERPYWRRVWIQQEVICAQDAIVHCGFHSERMIAFGRTSTAIDHCRNAYPPWSRPQILKDVNIAINQADLLTTRATSINATATQRRGMFTQRGIIFGLLRQQYHNGVTDPRDKVYGIAGLIEPWSNGRLVVSYTKSIREVYCEAVRLLLEQCGVDGMLIFCDMFRIPYSARIDLPSWCPDMSHIVGMTRDKPGTTICEDDLPHSLYRWRKGRTFSAAGSVLPELTFSDCGSRMTCQGLILDNIKTCSPELFIELEHFQKQVKGLPVESVDSNTHSAVSEVCWRTLCTDRPFSGSYDDPILHEAPKFWGTIFHILCSEAASPFIDNTFEHVGEVLPLVNMLPGGAELSSLMPRQEFIDWFASLLIPFLQAVRMATLKRRFVTSSKGYMGLVPIDTQVGDTICVVFGCPLPVILRPVNGYFVFIGEAYVHQWMDGQAMQLYKTGELKRAAFQVR